MISLIDESIILNEINKLDYKNDDTYLHFIDNKLVNKFIHKENEQLSDFISKLDGKIWSLGYQLCVDEKYIVLADHFYNPIIKLTRNEMVRFMDKRLSDIPELMKISILPKRLISFLKLHGFIKFGSSYIEDAFNKLVSHQDEVIKRYDDFLRNYSRFVNKGVY